MDMPSTYLTWVDFSGTGMSPAEIDQRVGHQARLAASPGTDFGTGGELCKRFNIAKPRYLLVEAIERLEAAFSDLQ
jgi:cystathionine beta-lyase